MKMNLFLALAALTVYTGSVFAAEVKLEDVASLPNPAGIAVDAQGTVFVSTSDGKVGSVVKLDGAKAVPVITDFPQGSYGKGPKYAIGPLGLAFTDKGLLVVGGGGLADGEELLRVYELGDTAKKASDMVVKFGPLAATDDLKGEGNFYGVAVAGDTIYVTSNGDDTKGWVARAKLKGNKVGEGLKRFLATKEKVEVDAPVGITMSPEGYIVVGQMGEITVPGDALLSYYSSKGKLLMNLETGLHDITAVAYSPKGKLYVLDFAWNDTTQGGLFRIDAVKNADGSQSSKAVKIVSLDKPTAMAFGKNGELYITSIKEDGAGRVQKIAPGL
jgi:DNA-binding beta-propeller fold protein YncE